MTEENRKKTLGRGLSALLSDIGSPNDGGKSEQARGRDRLNIPIEQIKPNPDQPRRSFEAGALEELAASIRAKGVLQPVIVRPSKDGIGYEIVAGERRWRAAQLAGQHVVPSIVRDLSDAELLEIAIIENVQRSDLNPIEEAVGYRQLMDRFGHTQDKLSEALSKSRSYIANLLRLLTLPEDVIDHVRAGRLSAGHARALITSGDASKIAQEVISGALSVRDTERLVGDLKSGPSDKKTKLQKHAPAKDADTLALEGDLASALRMGVSIRHEPGTGRGTVTLTYNSLEDLDLLCNALSGVDRDA